MYLKVGFRIHVQVIGNSSAGDGIRTHERLRDRLLKQPRRFLCDSAPLAWLGYPCLFGLVVYSWKVLLKSVSKELFFSARRLNNPFILVVACILKSEALGERRRG